MFIVYKDGREIGTMYYFGDAMVSLLNAYKGESKAPEDRARVLARTFITMVMDVDKKETYDITVPLAKEIGMELGILNADGKVSRDSVYPDHRKIYRILVNKGLIKNIL